MPARSLAALALVALADPSSRNVECKKSPLLYILGRGLEICTGRAALALSPSRALSLLSRSSLALSRYTPRALLRSHAPRLLSPGSCGLVSDFGCMPIFMLFRLIAIGIYFADYVVETLALYPTSGRNTPNLIIVKPFGVLDGRFYFYVRANVYAGEVFRCYHLVMRRTYRNIIQTRCTHIDLILTNVRA